MTMTRKWKPGRRFSGWWVLAPTALIVALMLLMTGATSSSEQPSPPRTLLTQLLFPEQKPVCESCHPQEYAAWQATTHAKATLDPVFQEQLAKSHDQKACLACH